MLIKHAPDLRESDVTPKEFYVRRREFLRVAGSATIAIGAASALGSSLMDSELAAAQNPNAQKLPDLK